MAASSTILSFIISVTTAGAQNITSLGNNISRLQGIYMGLAGVVGGVVVQAIRRAALDSHRWTLQGFAGGRTWAEWWNGAH